MYRRYRCSFVASTDSCAGVMATLSLRRHRLVRKCRRDQRDDFGDSAWVVWSCWVLLCVLQVEGMVSGRCPGSDCAFAVANQDLAGKSAENGESRNEKRENVKEK